MVLILYDDFAKLEEAARRDSEKNKEAREQSFVDFVKKYNGAIENGKFAFDSGANE